MIPLVLALSWSEARAIPVTGGIQTLASLRRQKLLIEDILITCIQCCPLRRHKTVKQRSAAIAIQNPHGAQLGVTFDLAEGHRIKDGAIQALFGQLLRNRCEIGALSGTAAARTSPVRQRKPAC